MKKSILSLLFCIYGGLSFGQSPSSGNTPQLSASGIITKNEATHREANPVGQPQLNVVSVTESENHTNKSLEVPRQPAVPVNAEAENATPKKD